MVKEQQKHTHSDHRHLIILKDNKIYLESLSRPMRQFFSDWV